MSLNDGDILVHNHSGTFAELIKSPQGYSLSFTMRFGGKTIVSKTQCYPISEILNQWRHVESDEIHMFNKGKLSIWG